MFGGKTTRMLAALERYQYQNKKTILFKPRIDKRYSEETVVTHKGQEHKCALVETGAEVYNLSRGYDVIGCDELFMVEGSADALIKLFQQGKTVLVSSLQLSSTSEFLPKGYEPFDEVQKIMPWATKVEVCPAVCYKCDRDAYYTERLAREEKKVLVGGAESYQPVCYKHSIMGKE
jgi:thymidine kinase